MTANICACSPVVFIFYLPGLTGVYTVTILLAIYTFLLFKVG